MNDKKLISVAVGIFFFGFYFCNSSLYAQSKSGKRLLADEEPFAAKRYFSFSIIPLLAAKASIKGDTNKYSLQSASQLSIEALVNYYYEFERNYSLIFGAGGGVIGHNFDFVIPKEMFDPPTGSDITSNRAVSREKDLFYIKLPVEVERKWIANSGNHWNTNIGISLLFSPQKNFETGNTIFLYNGQSHRYLIINQNNNNNGKPWLNYHLAGGYSWFLPKKNSIRANLKVNFSFTEFGYATYKFILPSQPILEGQYGITGSYIGLSLSYIFSGPNASRR